MPISHSVPVHSLQYTVYTVDDYRDRIIYRKYNCCQCCASTGKWCASGSQPRSNAFQSAEFNKFTHFNGKSDPAPDAQH
jgi:hypothetical protein